MSPPGIEIGCVRVMVGGGGEAMEVEDKLVWRQNQTAEGTFDTFGPRRVVTGRNKTALATPATIVVHLGKIFCLLMFFKYFFK